MTAAMDMSDLSDLCCYRCGANLRRLTLPLARLDLCPACSVELHVCRMCAHFQPSAPGGCREDDAEEVFEKFRANFCDYFRPNPGAFDGSLQTAEQRARNELASMFGEAGKATGPQAEAEGGTETDAAVDRANALFDR